jgi:hypothetical protein
MAMTIFLVLSGLSVAFMLYVLVNFWKEGHRQPGSSWKHSKEPGRRDWAEVVVVTHPISHAAHGGLSVIPFPVKGRGFGDSTTRALHAH